MCWHVIGPFDVVDPAGIDRGKAIERAREVGPHVRIGIFLDDERRRRMTYEKQKRTILGLGFGDEP